MTAKNQLKNWPTIITQFHTKITLQSVKVKNLDNGYKQYI